MLNLHSVYVDNKEKNQNISVKQDIDLEEVLFLFIQLYRSTQYQKINGKDILDAIISRNFIYG